MIHCIIAAISGILPPQPLRADIPVRTDVRRPPKVRTPAPAPATPRSRKGAPQLPAHHHGTKLPHCHHPKAHTPRLALVWRPAPLPQGDIAVAIQLRNEAWAKIDECFVKLKALDHDFKAANEELRKCSTSMQTGLQRGLYRMAALHHARLARLHDALLDEIRINRNIAKYEHEIVLSRTTYSKIPDDELCGIRGRSRQARLANPYETCKAGTKRKAKRHLAKKRRRAVQAIVAEAMFDPYGYSLADDALSIRFS